MEEAKSEPPDDRSIPPTPALDPSVEGSKPASSAPSLTGTNPAQETQTAQDVEDDQHKSTVPDPQDYQTVKREQQKIVDRLTATVDTLVQEMKTVKDSIEYIKFQQKTFADHESTDPPPDFSEDIAALKRKVNGLSSKIEGSDGLEEEVSRTKKRIQDFEYAYANGEPMPDENGNDLEQVDLSNLDVEDTLSRAEGRKGYEDFVELLREAQQLELEGNEVGIPQGDGEDNPDDSPEDSTMQPQITSAEKVAAQKRRRQQSDSSSASSTSAPVPKKHATLPKVTGKPDWTTKPRSSSSTQKGKLTSLNDYSTIMVSDPEDSDYDPNSQPADADIKDAKDAHPRQRVGKKGPIRLPTPEWEKPDWEGPPTVNKNTRGKSTVRRGTSGRHPMADREMMRQSSSTTPTFNYHDNAMNPSRYPSEPSGQDFAEEPKRRDSQGRLLRTNGKVDGRSLRHQRAKAAMKTLGTPEQGESGEKKGYYQRSSEAIKEVKMMEKQGLGSGPPWPMKYYTPDSMNDASTSTPTPATAPHLSNISTTPNASGFVDAAALAKAGLGPKMGTFTTTSKNSEPGSNDGTAAAQGSSAEGAGGHDGADGKKWGEDHKKLMKDVFKHQKWR
ncbi:MAG: hypothetical protein Q9183_004516 [Haloplaca sp. 2 TL-2023]